jgi:hypothetical protein
MKLVLAFLLMMFALPLLLVLAQEKDKWKRVYTYDDSVVEINESKLKQVDERAALADFRTVYSDQQPLRGKPGVKYKSRFETIEFRCTSGQYRVTEVKLLDSKGKTIDSYQMTEDEDWKSTKSGGMMQKLLGAACGILYQRGMKR